MLGAVLAARVVETGCRCWVPVLGAGAGCARGGDRVLGKLANCAAVDLWSQHGCGRSHSEAVHVVDGLEKVLCWKRMSKVCRFLKVCHAGLPVLVLGRLLASVSRLLVAKHSK